MRIIAFDVAGSDRQSPVHSSYVVVQNTASAADCQFPPMQETRITCPSGTSRHHAESDKVRFKTHEGFEAGMFPESLTSEGGYAYFDGSRIAPLPACVRNSY